MEPETEPGQAPVRPPPSAATRARAAALVAVVAGVAYGGGDALGHATLDDDIAALLGPWRWPVATAAALVTALGALAAAFLVRAFARGAPRPIGAAHVRAAIHALAIGAAIQFAAMQPFKTGLFHVAIALGLGLVPVVVLAGGARAGPAPRAVRALDVVLLNVWVLAVAGEAGLRLLGHLRPSPLLARTDATARSFIETYRHPPGRLWIGFPCNRGGHYDVEFAKTKPSPGTFRVVSISDSFAFGAAPHHHHFTTVCERELPGVEVLNLGVSGIGPREYAWLLEHEGLALAPDAIVVHIYVGNDILGSRRGAVRELMSRDNLLIYQVPRRLLRLSEEAARRPDRGEARYLPEVVEPEVQEVVPPEKIPERFPWVADPLKEVGTFSEETYRRIGLDRLSGFATREPRHFEAVLGHIEEMRRLAGPVPFLVVVIPDEFQVEDSLFAEAAARLGPQGQGIERDRPQRILGAELARRGIAFVDLLPVLRAVPPLADGRTHTYRLRDTHFNARGNEVAGKALAAALRPHLERFQAHTRPPPRG